MSEGQRAYEARRAARAGVSLERWLADKRRAADLAARTEARERRAATPKPSGVLTRLLERAQKPFEPKGRG